MPTHEILTLPHSVASFGMLLALVIAFYLRTTLTRGDSPVAGGRELHDVVLQRSAGDILRETKSALKHGWSFFSKLPILRASTYLAGAIYSTVQVGVFLLPLFFWDVYKPARGSDSVLVSCLITMFYWGLMRSMRSLGSWYVSDRSSNWTARYQGLIASALTLIIAGSFLLMGELADLQEGGSPALSGLGDVLESAALPLILLLVAIIYVLVGVAEPILDALSSSFSPPDLRSVLGSYRAAFAGGLTAFVIFAVSVTSSWYGSGGARSFGHAFATFGLLLLIVSFAAIPALLSTELRDRAPYRWRGSAYWFLALIFVFSLILFTAQYYAVPAVTDFRGIVGFQEEFVFWPNYADQTTLRGAAYGVLIFQLVLALALPIVGYRAGRGLYSTMEVEIQRGGAGDGAP